MLEENGLGAVAHAEVGDDVIAGRSNPSNTQASSLSAAAAAAQAYHARGWVVVPVPAGQKRPAMSAWPQFRAATGDLSRLFGDGENVAIMLGAASGELVDIDLDCPESIALADLYLPATRGVFGRASKPASHRLYVAPGAMHEVFADPRSGATLIELRAAGRDGGAHLTLFPPSIADTERREWCGDIIAPAAIEAVRLRTAVAWLAIGCLVLRYVGDTPAHNPGPDLPDLLWEVDRALGRRAHDWLGMPHPDLPRRHPRPRWEMSVDALDFADMIAAIPNTFDWTEWNAIGMAIYAASSGSEDGFIAFDDLSARSPKYDPHATFERWRNYRRSPPSRTGIGKLIRLALAAGWRPAAHRERVAG